MSLPLCLLTIWYYHYALSLRIAKSDPASAWHSELNTSLRTTARNHNSEPTKSIRSPGSANDPADLNNSIGKTIQNRLTVRLWHRFHKQVAQVRQGPLFGYSYRAAGDSLPATVITYRGMLLL